MGHDAKTIVPKRVTDVAKINNMVRDAQKHMNYVAHIFERVEPMSAEKLRMDAFLNLRDLNPEVPADQLRDIAWEAGKRFDALTKAPGHGDLPPAARYFRKP